MKRTYSDVMGSVVQNLCESIDSPRSLSVWLCYKYNQKELLELSSQTDFDNNDTDMVRLDYFISTYLSKYVGLKTGVDLAGVAISGWRSAESSCKAVNEKFRGLRLRPFTGRVEAWLFAAQRKIASVLGTLNVPLILDGCQWGPGATYDLRRSDAFTDEKISRAFSVTLECLPYFRAIVQADPHWGEAIFGVHPEGRFSLLPSSFKIVRGSRLLTVPKSAKTDRVIAAEPTGNSFCQQGVRLYLRRRLKRFGIDLDDQSINQELAREAYSSRLSTLDLSAASDTIARELVAHLLPLDWWMFLDSLRSHYTEVEGEWVHTEKFASMGNAFCFELETLIFWALASSVRSDCSVAPVVSVYGDDIIVEERNAADVIELLHFCGFTVNLKKSYVSGNFFESCGKHFHRGLDVTPVYQKKTIESPSEIIRAHNRLYRYGKRFGCNFSKALGILREAYPWRPVPRIPFGADEDGGFLADSQSFSLDKNHGFRCRVLDFVPGYSPAQETALYSYNLRRRNASRFSAEPNPLNAGPRGEAFRVMQGRWRTKVRWIPESALIER